MAELITHDRLPRDLIVVYEAMKYFKEVADKQMAEIHSGSYLIRKTAREHFKAKKVDVIADKYEKPRAFVNGKEISVSFSHTKNGVVLAMSEKWNIGCDMELSDRKINESIRSRMRHPEETDEFYQNVSPIRIWTFKEAALKMIGTGLRKPMNSIKISQPVENSYEAEINNGNRAKICSFKYDHHWISICYQT